MPKSRSTRMPREGATVSGRRASLDSLPTSRGTVPTAPSTGASGPEWTTAHWKLQVEAEARNRLKKSIRNLGSER
jgi:hypothetical protein